MEPTGERTVPGIGREQYFFARHEAVYRWICDALASAVTHARVLDAGSGEGYGADLLAQSGPRIVLGIEYDDEACRHAHRFYRRPSIVRANLADLPVLDGSLDVVVTLQVIEHLWDLPGFLVDLLRVTRPGGHLVASTPNRPVFSPGLGRGERPVNPFHVEEFDAEQVRHLIGAAGWSDVEVLGLHHSHRILEWEERNGSIIAAQVAAMTNGVWPADLMEFIVATTSDDFTITHDTDTAQDLIAIGRAPAPAPAPVTPSPRR